MEMESLDVQVLTRGLRWVRSQPIWLCTVISTFGSSPRPPGTMMVIRSDGQYHGSLSGGCIEESFIMLITQGALQQESEVVRYGAGGRLPNKALPCGGVVDILVERCLPGTVSITYLQTLLEALRGNYSLLKVITPPQACEALTKIAFVQTPQVTHLGSEIHITLSAPMTVIIAGLSNVAVCCANFSVSLGFTTLVCEHREGERASLAHELSAGVELINEFPAKYLERSTCHPATAILALTHDSRIDDLTMMEAVLSPAFYIGAMGSINTSTARKSRLLRSGGVNEQDLARIRAPIGLNIGSKTPAEIALAIMADIVRCKNGKEGHPLAHWDH